MTRPPPAPSAALHGAGYPFSIKRILAPLVTIAFFALAAATAQAHPAVTAQAPSDPINDLFALGQGFGQTPTRVPTERRAEPPLVATPRAQCASGDRTEPGIQGRVPAGTANNGFTCNTTLVGQHGSSGGFKVYRYTDKQGRDCAFYDTSLLFPLNALHPEGRFVRRRGPRHERTRSARCRPTC